MNFDSIKDVSVEHMLGAATNKPAVKLRVVGDKTTLIDNMSPENARDIAQNLMLCAARSEYEADLWQGLKDREMPDDMIAAILLIVREGETRREES